MTKFVKLACLGLLVVVPLISFVGCDGGGSGGSSSSVAGTWQLTSNEGAIYLVLNADGSLEFRGSPNEPGSVTGSYSVSGDNITGTFTSAAKSGTIDATITDGVMTLNFNETNPAKTIQYTGSKM
jgi:hypothetical protein